MENEQTPNFSTQKEEPVIPTPAHPLPKFLPKPIALIVIILITTALLSGLVFTAYNLGKNSVLKELNPTTPVIPPKDPVIYEATLTPASNAADADPATEDWQEARVGLNKNFTFKYPDDWTYTEDLDFVIIYPPNISIVELKNKDEAPRISLYKATRDPESCKGDCPLIKESRDVQVGSYEAREIKGTIGSVGGNIPQDFIETIIKTGNSYLVIGVYGGENVVISSSLKEIYRGALSTFRFD